MRSSSPTPRPDTRRPAWRTVVVSLGLAAAVGCAPDGESAMSHDHAAATGASGTSLGQPDAVISGPQGNDAQFLVSCDFSHAAQDDPIVHPGEPDASHLHVFFGNTGTDAYSTLETLLGGATSCDQPLDTAAYWAPALFRGNEMLEPIGATAYYRAGVGMDPSEVEPYPAGLLMVAGNARATERQPLSIVAWSCGVGAERWHEPQPCPDSRALRMMITFPDCWDGVNLDSADHHGHVAYSTGGACPSSHQVPIPQLQFVVEYPVWGDVTDLVLASGGLLTGHADFMNAWDQRKLETEVRVCLNRRVVCGIASGRADG